MIAQLTTAENLIKSLIGTKRTKISTVNKITEPKQKMTVIGRLETKRTYHVSASVELSKTYTHTVQTRRRTGETVTREIPESMRRPQIDLIPIAIAVQATSSDDAKAQFMQQIKEDYTRPEEE